MAKQRKGFEFIELIRKSKNVRNTCQQLGISRSQYYQLLKQPTLTPSKTYAPKKMGLETANRILELALSLPLGCHSISDQLQAEGVKVSPVSVQKLLNHHQLGTASARFSALEQKIYEARGHQIGFDLNAEQKEFIRRYNPALIEIQRNIQAPGELVSIFGHFLGQFPWLGKVYLYFAVDAYSGFVQGMLSYAPDKYLCAAFLQETIFPFYERNGLFIKQVETSVDPEFFSYSIHPFSSFLRGMPGVQHLRTTIGGFKTNGFCERWNQYLQRFIVPDLKKHKQDYQILEELHQVLQSHLERYNQGTAPGSADHFGTYPFFNKSPREIIAIYLTSN